MMGVRMMMAMMLGVVMMIEAVPYPLDASWFANRWTVAEWKSALTEFKQTGGSIVWQRGATFRQRSLTDILHDDMYVWCWALERCTDKAVADVAMMGAKIANWFTYQNDEDLDPKSMLKCPFDLMINSSRIYYRVIVPHNNYDANWDCKVTRGMEVDVIFTEFAGTDPHKLLITAASDLDVSVYLPMPQIPDDTLYWPAYFEFTKRVLKSYSVSYDQKYRNTYKGVYQTNECFLPDYQRAARGNTVISKMVHDLGKQFVISPYIDLNRAQVLSNVADHKNGFKQMALSGADVIAVQEGRGCAKGCYWWSFQANDTVVSVDPMLDRVYNYIAPSNWAGGKTFNDMFTASNQQVFAAFEEAVEELKQQNGITVELWLNLEAFEYLRDYPCLPVDRVGNGMAELLDRTSKHRIDWGLTVAGSRVAKTISFAWDADYLCVTEDPQFSMSLAEEIRMDWQRPIISLVDRVSGVVRGFNLVDGSGTGKVVTEFTVSCASGAVVKGVQAVKGDAQWGAKNNRQPLLQQVVLAGLASVCPVTDQHVCVTATNIVNGLSTYHEYCHEL